jgi:hypothetical protein
MKTRISLIILEIMCEFQVFGGSNTRFVVDDDYNIMSKYITTKTAEDTLQDLMYEYTNIDARLYNPKLMDFIHEEKSTECEAVYTLTIPRDIISLNKGYIVEESELFIENKYERAIRKTPRSFY